MEPETESKSSNGHRIELLWEIQEWEPILEIAISSQSCVLSGSKVLFRKDLRILRPKTMSRALQDPPFRRYSENEIWEKQHFSNKKQAFLMQSTINIGIFPSKIGISHQNTINSGSFPGSFLSKIRTSQGHIGSKWLFLGHFKEVTGKFETPRFEIHMHSADNRPYHGQRIQNGARDRK